MLISVWEYLRARARDALLAGFQDALDIIEGEDTDGIQHEQANRLLSRLQNSAERTIEPGPNAKVVILSTQAEGKPQSPRKPAAAPTFDDDEFARRLNAPPAQGGSQAPAAPGRSQRKRRGRPPKRSEGQP